VRLRIPSPSLVVLVGPAASGKSTFAARHFPTTAIVSSDRCRAMLADDERNLAVSRQAFELFHYIIDARLGLRRLTVADSTALQPSARRALLEIGRRRGVPVVAIVFDLDVEECYKHDTLRDRRVGRAIVERHVRLLHEALKTISGEGFDEVVVLDAAAARRASVEVISMTAPEPVTHRVGSAQLRLVLGDITEQRVDAIVNAANSRLVGGGGVDGAIRRAGGPAIEEECARIRAQQGGCPTGSAVITGAGRLPARFVIHAVGPVWHGGDHGEAEQLASAYRSSLALAAQHGVRTIAFPSISTGIYGYPIAQAARVALRTVLRELASGSFEEIRFVLFSAGDFAAYAEALQQEVASSEG
jgi:O-acetyl-ADP-ribose deacetylase (regulator of RNase III)/predicted kinase